MITITADTLQNIAGAVNDWAEDEIDVRDDWMIGYTGVETCVAFLIGGRYGSLLGSAEVALCIAEVLGLADAKEAVSGAKEEGLGLNTYAIFPNLRVSE